ncbi:hypothetical protein QA601_10625 [Chitinispirillales bacterium ANBcel5]|uniref:hypothetical protein n=1 Tax=Cellulosispirillum alkaliphilum TaxID=3039283 RepID=UPI002A51D393|nr:hypothetical protein [Chitinispirillales bacterium ANBcel5]
MGIEFPGVNSTDIGRFIETAHQVQMTGLVGNLDVTQSYVWSWLLGLVMLVSKDTVFAPLVFNSVLGTLVVVSLHKTAVLLGTPGSAKMSSWLIALCPPLIFNSAILLRETLLLLLLSQLFFYILYTFKNHSFGLKYITVILMYFILLVIFHGAFVILLLPILVTMIYPFLTGQKRFLSKHSFVIFVFFPLILSLILYYSIQAEIGHSKLYFLYNSTEFSDLIWNSITFIGRRAQDSELIAWSQGSGFLFNKVELIIKSLFGPFFAGEFRNFDIIRMVIVLYVNFNLFILFLKSFFPSGINRIGLFFIFINIAGFAVISTYYEHAFRHYMKVVPLIITLSTPIIYNFLKCSVKHRIETNKDF